MKYTLTNPRPAGKIETAIFVVCVLVSLGTAACLLLRGVFNA